MQYDRHTAVALQMPGERGTPLNLIELMFYKGNHCVGKVCKMYQISKTKFNTEFLYSYPS